MIENMVVPFYASFEFLLLVAVALAAAGMHLLKRINTCYWGANGLLYLLSGRSIFVGRVLASLPGLALCGLAVLAATQAFAFLL